LLFKPYTLINPTLKSACDFVAGAFYRFAWVQTVKMAFEEIWEIIVWIVQFAIILFPTVYLLDLIMERIDTKTTLQKVLVIFAISLMLSLAVYPFIAAMGEYILALEYDLDVSLVLFDSDLATYLVVLLFVFLLYLIVFNKTK